MIVLVVFWPWSHCSQLAAACVADKLSRSRKYRYSSDRQRKAVHRLHSRSKMQPVHQEHLTDQSWELQGVALSWNSLI